MITKSEPFDALIVDRKSGAVIAAGIVINRKRSIPLISFDNLCFYHYGGNNRYRVVINHGLDIQCRTLLPQEHPDGYVVLPWQDSRHNVPADVYYERSSYDESVKDIIAAINIIPGARTISSCSGHGRKPLYVSIIFATFESLKFLLDLIHPLREDLKLTTDVDLYPDEDSPDVCFNLKACRKGHVGTIATFKLAKAIREKLCATDFIAL